LSNLIDLLPLYQRTEAVIRADYNARANAGLSSSDPDWVDTRDGSWFQILSQPSLVEAAKLWAALTEMAAAANLGTAWGEFLDNWAESLGLERLVATPASGTITITGTNGTLVGVGAQFQVPQTDPEQSGPTFAATQSGTIAGGTLVLAIEAVEPGVDGNVGATAISLLRSPISGITAVSNVAATTGGTEVETDEDLRDRITLQFAPRGNGTVADYERWARDEVGVGRVTVVPVWNGGGTVLVVISTASGDPVAQAVIDSLQARLDPVPGQGAGQAPIGHTVTVATVAAVTITVASTISFKTGYTLTGTGGTVALSDAIKQSIIDYVDNLEPGDDVIHGHVRSQIFEIEGVLDVTALTVNGSSSANVAIALTPTPQVASIGTGNITLT
jgi:uncharacterized phage protein gp47/JayE